MDPIIEARGVEKYYTNPDGHRIEVISPTDLSIWPGKIVALLGPSGCGKSSLLRLLSGLAQPSSGEILWDGEPLDGLPHVSIVFQSFALFPWLTVSQNVEAPLRALGIPPYERRKRALKILDTVGLDGFETAYPKELSGGMKQRVGFARALVVEPDVLFMDEPFSALDVLTSENLKSELLELWLEKRMPTRAIFMVTHNIEEAVFLADKIMILGGNPARITTELNVTFAHPRDRKDNAFIELVDEIYKALTRKKTDPAPAVDLKPATVPEAAAAVRYPALPQARPGSIAGLLEILADHGGQYDLYRLADELTMDVDDILPIVDATAILQYVQIHEGDVVITPQGTEFANADILSRKVLFGEAALKNVTLLRQIDHSLRAKSNHTLPDDFFHDILEKHFSEEAIQQQLDTVINWGRYAEIFDHDADSGQFLTMKES